MRLSASADSSGYDPVILGIVKTAISLPDETFERVERAAAQLGVSRSEFFARAAERWLRDLDDAQTTDAINQALAGVAQDTAFIDVAAARVAQRSDPT
jgi:metal-responsive CopG/Arc/MetJ family transcriptional regulator